MTDKDIDPSVRRANLRLAIILGLVAFGFFAAFIYVTGTSR
jgi:hypothetical protein